MVDVKTETQAQPEFQARKSPRDAIRERGGQRRLRLVSADRNATVKVFAANDAMREVLRHPSGNRRFRDTLDQGVGVAE